jgi:hypothetical protein
MPFERVLASLRIDGEQPKERTPSAGPLAGPSSTDCNPPLALAPRPELHRAAPVPSIRSVRFGWGYTNVRSDYTVLPPMICAGAMSVGRDSTPARQQAAGVWMLVHEAFHLRHWRFRRNEAKVGCQTIVYFTDAAARGASDSQAQQLYPYGLALHDLELDLYPWHRDPKCVVPPWLPPSAP